MFIGLSLTTAVYNHSLTHSLTHHSAERPPVALIAVAIALVREGGAADAGARHRALQEVGGGRGDAPEALLEGEHLDRRAAVRRAVRALGAADALVEVGQAAVVVVRRVGRRCGLREQRATSAVHLLTQRAPT